MLIVAEARAGGGTPEGADEAFREALELLAEHGSLRQHAAALRSYGRFLRDEDREHEALDVFEQAAEVASNLQVEPAGAGQVAPGLWKSRHEPVTDTSPLPR